jgi:hypothetical protein
MASGLRLRLLTLTQKYVLKGGRLEGGLLCLGAYLGRITFISARRLVGMPNLVWKLHLNLVPCRARSLQARQPDADIRD